MFDYSPVSGRLSHLVGRLKLNQRLPWKQISLVVGLAFSLSAHASQTPTDWLMVPASDSGLNYAVLRGTTPIFDTRIIGWSPGWAFRSPPACASHTQGDSLIAQADYIFDKNSGEAVTVHASGQTVAPDRVGIHYSFDAAKDVPVTLFVIGINVPAGGEVSSVVLKSQDGQAIPLAMPLGRQSVSSRISEIDFTLPEGGLIALVFKVPAEILLDSNQLRVVIAKDKLSQGSHILDFDIHFPSTVAFPVTDADRKSLSQLLPDDTWFPFIAPTTTLPPDQSVIGMEDWLEKPAGKHGGVRSVGDHFELEDGSPIQFWGTNISYAECAPPHNLADAAAAHFAHYGINGVRLHKFLGPDGWQGIADKNDATKFAPAGLDRFDYFCSKLAENGIYYGFSHTFKFIVAPGNRDRLLAYDEIAKYSPDQDTYSLINVAEDIQDLMIERTVNLLNHVNPYTGKKYSEDPAVSYIEFQNEDDIFFFSTSHALKECPTYRAAFEKRYNLWLKQKYQSRDALKASWGAALKDNESWDDNNISVCDSPWQMSEEGLRQLTPEGRTRIFDSAAFYHACQNKFYDRFSKAIRDAGYKGPLVGSCWQAPAMMPHYYNLRSDYLTGVIDRHNYFGGQLFDSMLKSPGSGYLGSGLQQVIDRPFVLSEWITCYPSLYSADGPAMVAAYGLGLQGWDASYEFTSKVGNSLFADGAGHLPFGVWAVDLPTQIGQFPTLARMIYRHDVKVADVISTRRISLDDIATDKFNFSEQITQGGDVKTFNGSAPAVSLAVGRATVQFVDHSQPSTFTDLSPYIRDGVVQSTTGQLAWTTSGKGFFTIDTAGTKGVVGFAGGQTVHLSNFDVAMKSPYASVILTASKPNETLENATSAIVSVIARNCNTGFVYYKPTQQIMNNGNGPVLLEPVDATIASHGRHITSVNILDHAGCRTSRVVPVINNGFHIDGMTDKAIYYEITFDK